MKIVGGRLRPVRDGMFIVSTFGAVFSLHRSEMLKYSAPLGAGALKPIRLL